MANKRIELLKLNELQPAQRRLAVKRIQKGITHIQTRGWCQGDYEDAETGKVCAIGSLGIGRGVDRHDDTATDAAKLITAGILAIQPRVRLVKDFTGDIATREVVISWNDRRGRTKGQVLRAFKKAVQIGQSL